MKKSFLYAMAVFSMSTLFVACSDSNDDNEENYRRIDQILSGENLASATLSTYFTWNGKQLTQVDEIEDDIIYNQTRIRYVDASSQKIAEIGVYAQQNPLSKSIYGKVLNIINHYQKKSGKELVQYLRVVPTYTDGKVTKLDLYGNPMGKELPYFGYFEIKYQNGNPTEMNLKLSQEIVVIDVMKRKFYWSNGNIVKATLKMLNIESQPSTLIDVDSTVYSYDDKYNVFSALKSSPMLDPQTNSRNNIVEAKSFIYTENGPVLNETSTSTYQYDSNGYPTSATDVWSWGGDQNFTMIRKFEYKPE
ncbi:MAG TPA: hypothetical protein PK990_00320 [Salinivirgaceae bacterium]|nr:hypothetical protein [Salinivirgaceae bacterium]